MVFGKGVLSSSLRMEDAVGVAAIEVPEVVRDNGVPAEDGTESTSTQR